MAVFPTLLAIPGSLNVRLFKSVNNSSINGVEIDFSATLASGAKFDLSNTASYSVILDNSVTNGYPGFAEVVVPNTKLTATVTGGSLSLAGADLLSAMNSLLAAGPVSNGKITILALDASNTLLVASGSWSINVVP